MLWKFSCLYSCHVPAGACFVWSSHESSSEIRERLLRFREKEWATETVTGLSRLAPALWSLFPKALLSPQACVLQRQRKGSMSSDASASTDSNTYYEDDFSSTEEDSSQGRAAFAPSREGAGNSGVGSFLIGSCCCYCLLSTQKWHVTPVEQLELLRMECWPLLAAEPGLLFIACPSKSWHLTVARISSHGDSFCHPYPELSQSEIRSFAVIIDLWLREA